MELGQAQKAKSVLVLGASGMLGNALLRYFDMRGVHPVQGSVRSEASKRLLPAKLQSKIIVGADLESPDSLNRLFADVRPQVVINSIGLVKQVADSNDPLHALQINALLPHRLARLCAAVDARLIHISTDCVFLGDKGGYKESDVSDARDLYGRSKFLGEVAYQHAITLRTSIIGHELNSNHGLIDWFLSQSQSVKGYTKAVFSGLPTVELARVIHDFVLPNDKLSGVFHVSAQPIDKCSLLTEVAKVYGKSIQIVPDEEVVIDRSLDSTLFTQSTGYVAPPWQSLIRSMHEFGRQ